MDFYNYKVAPLTCPDPFMQGPTLNDVCPASSMALFLTLLNTYVNFNKKINQPCSRVDSLETTNVIYDFVVIGGGAGGSVVAGRLSEIPQWKVLLIEAGPDEPGPTEIPSIFLTYLGGQLDWNYLTQNESNACLANNGRCVWPRGKNLGGCTVHHGMAYHRGCPKDYENWVKAGNPGWSWEEVLPYFYMGEDNQEIGRVEASRHGVGGPMNVERLPYQPSFAWDILDAAKESGYGTINDLVGKKPTGFTVAQTLSKNGVRQSTAAAYIRAARDRDNLHVMLNATATRIGIVGKKAVAVHYHKNGRNYRVRVKREVIVAGGAINSPQLLLLSGIGPKEHLQSMGIKPIVDLPGVGQNLHNHVSYALDFVLDEPDTNLLNPQTTTQYLYNQTGPLASTGLAQVTGVLASSYTTPDFPDIQIFFSGYQASCNTKDLSPVGGNRTVRMTSVNLHSKSNGVVRLNSKDPLEAPYIWGNDLGEPEDVEVVLQGVHVILNLTNTTVMKKRGAKLVKKDIRGCSMYEYGTDDYFRCAIRYDTRPENHQAGTCKMGSPKDPMAVVDPQLRVYGVKGIRVADAAAMPRVVSGNPVAAINMIGERAADFIKKQYKK